MKTTSLHSWTPLCGARSRHFPMHESVFLMPPSAVNVRPKDRYLWMTILVLAQIISLRPEVKRCYV